VVDDLGQDRSRTSGLTVQPRSASRGRTSSTARVIVERSAPSPWACAELAAVSWLPSGEV
jgi:hypothetical protein